MSTINLVSQPTITMYQTKILKTFKFFVHDSPLHSTITLLNLNDLLNNTLFNIYKLNYNYYF
jgi:hypothetical protein